MSYGGQMQYGPGIANPRPGPPQPGMNGPPPTQTNIQFMLDENTQLIQSIIDNHQQGTLEIIHYYTLHTLVRQLMEPQLMKLYPKYIHVYVIESIILIITYKL